MKEMNFNPIVRSNFPTKKMYQLKGSSLLPTPSYLLSLKLDSAVAQTAGRGLILVLCQPGS